MMRRIIFHVDVNSAFLSWESARRVSLGQQDLRTVPAIIGGSADKRTSVVLAKSISAKKFGIKTGEPVSMAVRKCPNLILAKPDFTLYRECSARFLEICRNYSPVVEQASIDECFMDMTGMELLYPDISVAANRIREEIKNQLGFTVNIGIGDNKLLAKMASDFEKPDKVHTLFCEEIKEKMWPLSVRDLLFVGESTAEKLERANIMTIGDLARLDQGILCAKMGKMQGEQLHRYANGEEDSPVRPEPETAKSYNISTTTEDDIVQEEDACRILRVLAEEVTFRMRSGNHSAGSVEIVLRGTDFRNHSHRKKLFTPSASTDIISETAVLLFRELWDGKMPIRLIGIALNDLSVQGEEQISLIPDEREDRGRRIDSVMDQIREKYGKASIRRGSGYIVPDVCRKKEA